MPRRRLGSGPRRPIRSAVVKRVGSGCYPSRRRSRTSSQVMSDTIDRPHASVTNGSGAVKSYRLRLDESNPDEWDGSIPSPDGRASGAASTSQNTRQSLNFSRPLPRPKRRPKPRGGSARTGQRTSRRNPSRPAGNAFFWSFFTQGPSVRDVPRTPALGEKETLR